MANPKIKSSAQTVKKSNATAGRKPMAKSLYSRVDLEEIFRRFSIQRPEPKGELEHVNPFTLVVAVALSAQATDAGVNKATRALFAVADTPQKMLDLGEERIREYIKTIGLYRNKAKNVMALSEKLITDFGGEVPRTREELITLPGVGRNIFRIANRLLLAPGKTPDEVEHRLMQIIPDQYLYHAHHWLILHGRYCCKARKPECERCVIADLCRSPEKTWDIPAPLVELPAQIIGAEAAG